ncbi:STAS domain-containing protein [Actinoplanes sp. NPDC051343]|jgi:anti-anti-sigma factor|uniref:STAS domain-containing protein n=1 Tax=Actinoplanes sp. NPDC051343 TaxID=3363906 RepID=UPI0037911B65
MPEIPEAVVIVTEGLEGPAVERWARLIAEAVALHPASLIIDLRACPLVDAAAIAVLLRAHRGMVAAGGSLTLRFPRDKVRRTLRLARLDQVFEVDAGVPA